MSARPSAGRRLLRAVPALSCALLLAWAWRAAPPTLTRGPFLQSQSETTITVVFRTSESVAATVRYGREIGRRWEGSKASPVGTTHVVELTGLRPDSRYFYQVESSGAVLAGGEDVFFRTSPPQNSRAPFRFLAWGDSGNGSSLQRDVAKRMEETFPRPDFALGLGDLVYEDGAAQDYDPRLFQPYAKLFTRMTFWPTMGNHDYRTLNGAPYLDAFTLPKTSGGPGHPSNTELYYSFDEGMAHFACADSESMDSSPGSPMYTWIADDLDSARARGKRWLIVFMHHPPYSHGTHNSDTDPELIALRQNLVPLFEQKGVDLVLVGHSHVYERSYLAKSSAILQHDARDYTKFGTPNGTLYVVSGCGGESGTGSLDHPLMATSRGNVTGFSLVDVSFEDLRGSFVERDGRTTDLFRLHKDADRLAPRVDAVRGVDERSLQVVFDEPVRATGTGGAASAARYVLSDAAVTGAALASDQRTVTLTTTSLVPDRAHVLEVQGVSDLAGNLLTTPQRARFIGVRTSSSGGSTTLIARGASWRLRKGTTPPPSSWTALTFDDSSWSRCDAAMGYGYGGEGTNLSDMPNGYASIYLRASFSVADPAAVTALALGVAFDDGFVAYLNGTEVARGNMPAGAVSNATLASSSHEEAGFEPFDLHAVIGLLRPGANEFAIEGHNFTLGSPDFWLDLDLRATTGTTGGGVGPRAEMECDLPTANAPSWIAFDASRSTSPSGSFLRCGWDFGDGTRGFGRTVRHQFITNGTYDVTLTVHDAQGRESIATQRVRIQSLGVAPLVQLGASATQVSAGARVDFRSSGSLDPDGGALTVYWDFGDPASGEANYSSLPSASHVYATTGTRLARLVVTDDEGSMATRALTITVR